MTNHSAPHLVMKSVCRTSITFNGPKGRLRGGTMMDDDGVACSVALMQVPGGWASQSCQTGARSARWSRDCFVLQRLREGWRPWTPWSRPQLERRGGTMTDKWMDGSFGKCNSKVGGELCKPCGGPPSQTRVTRKNPNLSPTAQRCERWAQLGSAGLGVGGHCGARRRGLHHRPRRRSK